MNMTAAAPTITITPSAVERIRQMLEKRGTPNAAVRIGVTTRGCSGYSYKLEYADRVEEGDQLIETGGVRVVVDPKALLFIGGIEMDFVNESFKSGFKFSNPNEKGRCGCGESFTV